MKAVFDRKALAETVARVAPLAQSSRVKPILRNVLLEVDNGAAIFSATNLEQSLRVELSANYGAQSGKCLVSADKLAAILKSCQADLVELALDGQRVSITCGHGKWRLNTEDTAEFPGADFGISVGCEVQAGAFVNTLGIASVCTDSESTRFALAGVKLSAKQGALTAISTDGRRAVLVTQACGAQQDFEALVPISAVRLIERSLLAAGTALLGGDGSNFRVYGPGCAIWTRQLEGRFPSLDEQLRIFEPQLEVKLSAAMLLAGVQQAVVTASDDEPAIELYFADGSVRLASQGTIGEADVQLPASYTGAPAKWRVRPAYLREFLRVIGDVELTFALGAGTDGGAGAYPAGWAMLSTDSVKYIVGGLSDK